VVRAKNHRNATFAPDWGEVDNQIGTKGNLFDNKPVSVIWIGRLLSSKRQEENMDGCGNSPESNGFTADRGDDGCISGCIYVQLYSEVKDTLHMGLPLKIAI
jgi:hypothetical protein